MKDTVTIRGKTFRTKKYPGWTNVLGLTDNYELTEEGGEWAAGYSDGRVEFLCEGSTAEEAWESVVGEVIEYARHLLRGAMRI